MAQVGEKIKELRKQNKMSQAELAEKLFVSRDAVGKWERQIRVPDVNVLIKIADLFNISTDELLGRNFETCSRIGARFDETAISFFDMIQVYIEKAYEEKHPEHVLKGE